MHGMERWSVFDVDRTITKQPTYSLFLLFAARRHAPWRLALLPLLAPLAAAYACKALPRRAMKEAMHLAAMGRAMPRAAAQDAAEAFAAGLVREGLYPQAMELMERERQEGRRLALATAAPELYAEPLARMLGIDTVIASPSDWRADALGHRIAGENCYGVEKLRRIRAAVGEGEPGERGFHVRFYTDHASDRAVCEWADEAFAVNPSSAMMDLAQARGWPVLDWRGG